LRRILNVGHFIHDQKEVPMKVVLACTFAAAISFQSMAVNAADTLPYKKAQELGVKKCLAKVREMSNFVLKEAGHGSDTTWNNKETDSRLLSFLSLAVTPTEIAK